jgi:hypothetical protein
MKKKAVFLILLISAASVVYSEDETRQLLELLDTILTTATEIGKTVTPPAQSNPANPTFNIRNRTGFTIKSVSVNQTNSDKGLITLNGSLFNGQSVRVTLKMPLSEVNRYNIRMVDVDGAAYSRQDVEIIDSAVIEILISDFED